MKKRFYRNLKKYYYIETEVVGKDLEFTIWYARFTTIPIFGLRYTLIYGLDFEKFADLNEANRYMQIQRLMYKIAIKSKYKK